MSSNNCFEIPVSRPALIGNELHYVTDCLSSTWISSSGKYVGLFEKAFADTVGIKHALSCCNGTVALHLALLAIGVSSEDEVIVPALTYVATANAVIYTGATPVLADSDPITWNIDPSRLEGLINEKTKAIIAVPLYGHPCDMDALIELGRKHKLYVIEDAAEALGSAFKGKPCGSIADISTFSFYGNKVITTGEGGMVVMNDDTLAERVRILKGQGMDPSKRYWFPITGYNYRMTNIQAAIGLAQLENLDRFLRKRRLISSWYNKYLHGIPGIILPVEMTYAKHSFWLYSVLIEDEYGQCRDNVMQLLAANGIETRPVFYPMHIMPPFKRYATGNLKNAERIGARGISLPTFYDLMEKDVMRIADILRDKC